MNPLSVSPNYRQSKWRQPRGWLLVISTAALPLLIFGWALTLGLESVAAAPAAQTGWQLVWADEFNGTGQPDATNWNYVVGNGWNPGNSSFDGWGNGEWEWYRPENAYQSGGNLVIRADYSSTPLFVVGGKNWYQTSARLTTKGKRSIQYGAIEARIQMPTATASWPAFWMMGDEGDDTNTSNYAAPSSYYDINSSNWSSIGEIDIMEHKNADPFTFQNLFWDTRTGVFPWNCCTNMDSPSTSDVSNVATFHTYRMEWTASTLTWLIDGNVVKTKDVSAANQEEYRKPFHIYLNMAIAGRFPGTTPNQADFPLYMNVDYVRVYSTTSPVPTPTPVHTSGSWNLSWGDEFNGTGQPDATNWNYVVGNGWNPGNSSFDGWGNGEWEWYRPENAYQSGGNLVIRADYSSTPLFVVGGKNWYQTSARLTTKGKRSIQYGAIEARIQMPTATASWPAFWMMGDEGDDTNTSNYAAPSSYYDINSSNWSSIGEIDIMEHKNADPFTFQNLFWDTRTGVFPWNCCTNMDSPSTSDVSNVATFHTYRMEWTASTLTWLIDGNVVKTKDVSAANQEEYRKPFHIYLNMAIAGRFPGTTPNQADFPLYMNVDYVRVYTPGSGTPIPTPTSPPPTATPTKTNTPVPPTATWTNTPTGPTNTPTRTPTATPVPPTPTSTLTRTNTPTGPTATPTSSGGGCGTGTNLIVNPGFETGVLNPWTLATGNGGPTQARVHTGTWAGYVGTSLGRVEQVVNGLAPNTTYTLCGWFTLEVTSSTIQFGVKNYGGTQQTQTVNTSGSFVWVQLSMTFTTGAGNTSATVFFEQPTSGGNYGYSDDWWLSSGTGGPTNTPAPTATNTPVPPTPTPTKTNTPTSTNTPTATRTNTPVPPTATPTATSGAGGCGTGTNLIVNPGFETGVLNPWTLATGNGGPTQARVHTGTWSGYVGTSLGRVEQVVNGLSPNTTYTLCGWFTLEVTSSTIQFGVKNYGGAQQTQTVNTSGSFVWVQLSMTFTTGAGNTSATVFFEQPTTGGNYGYSDDWWLSSGGSAPTNTPGATATPTRTNTPTGPTNTPTRTNTPMPPTNTPVPTATNTPPPGGAAFYIDCAAGNDSNNGTSPSTPWRTLAKVSATTFGPGNNILFKSGITCSGTLALHGSGASGNPIIIDRYSTGSLPVIAGGGAANAIYLYNNQYVEVKNLEVTNKGATSANRRGVYVVAQDIGTANHIYLINLVVHDVNGDNNKDTGGSAGIDFDVIGNVTATKFNDILIDGCTIYTVDRSGIFSFSTWLGRPSHGDAVNNWTPWTNYVVRNNQVYDVGGDGIVTINTTNALVENNVVHDANLRSGTYNAGIWAFNADFTKFQFNEAYQVRTAWDGEGFDVDWAQDGTLMQYNYSHDNEGGFMLVATNGGVGTTTNAVIRYNISQNDRWRVFQFAGPSQNTLVYNNTLYTPSNFGTTIILQNDWGGMPISATFYNNIFYNLGTGVYTLGAGNVFDYNVFYGSHPASEPADAHKLTTNPLLLSPESGLTGLGSVGGYQLQAGSPAIGSGRVIANNGGRDFWGNPVPANTAPDRGAHQTGNPLVPAATPPPAGTNLVRNPGFEMGSLGAWNVWNGVAVVNNNMRSGSYAIQVGPSQASSEQFITGMKPGAAYTLVGWAKAVAGSTVTIGIKEYGGATININVTATTYTQVSIPFTNGSSTTAVIYCAATAGSGLGYCDDFSLIQP